jgi:hypothetical protein
MMANKKAARGGNQMINFHRWVVLFFHVLSEILVWGSLTKTRDMKQNPLRTT